MSLPSTGGVSGEVRLSQRMSAVNGSLLPKIRASIADRQEAGREGGGEGRVDLGTAENGLLRKELRRVYSEALSSGLDDAHFAYPDGFGGSPDLVSAFARFFNQHFRPCHEVLATHVVVAPGATTCLEALLHCICDPGDAVVVPGPFWNGFNVAFSVRPGVRIIPVGGDGSVSAILSSVDRLISALEAAVTPEGATVRALVLTNPHNPFGRCYSPDMLSACARFCQKHGLHLISDEVYALSVFDARRSQLYGSPFVSVLHLDLHALGVDPRRVHVVWSTSKDFGSSGIRIGAVVSQANEHLRISLALSSNIQVSSLAAAVTAVLLDHPDVGRLIELNRQRLLAAYGVVVAFLKTHGMHFVPAHAGLFVFAKLPVPITSARAEMHAVSVFRSVGVIVSPGTAYCWSDREFGWVRITFAVEPALLQEGLERLSRGLSVLSEQSRV